jgi:hypothetical protein
MSFIHNNSCECAKSELDLFAVPPTQTSIESGEWINYKPIASLTDDSAIEFVVPGHGDHYIDLANTIFVVSAKILNIDGTAVADGKDIAPVNNWLHSLFSQVDVFLNQKMISHPDHLYPYRAYIENLLNYNQTAKESHLTCALWYGDTGAKFDDVKNNAGFRSRKNLTSQSTSVEMIGRLHADIFGSQKYLLNGVELRIKLNRSKPSFCLQSDDGTAYKVQILDAALLMRRMTISPSVLLAHTKTLDISTAKYPLSRVDVKSVTISKDVTSKSIDNLFMGQLPKRIIVGFVLNSAMNGNFRSNPFNFKHFDMNFLCFYIDGRQIPSKPLQPDFGDDGSTYISSYHTLFTGTNINYKDDGNCISRSTYHRGYFLHAFDFTADLSASDSHWSLHRQGTLRMEVKFKKALPETISCIIYSEYDSLIEIDSYRNVIVDFAS